MTIRRLLALLTTLFFAPAIVLAQTAPSSSAPPAGANNPLFEDSPLPLHYPQFDKIEDRHFAEAFDAGMIAQLREIEHIATSSAPADFDNTIVALEKSGTLLRRARTFFFSLLAVDANASRQRLNVEYSPKFAAHYDAIWLNEPLFQRIQALYDARHQDALSPEALRLIEKYHADFLRAGAQLSARDKVRLRDMNEELAELGARFSQNVLNEVNASAVIFDNASSLAGADPAQIDTAAHAAAERGFENRYLVPLLNTTGQPALSYLSDRDARRRIFEASIKRGMQGNAYDNRAIIARVMTLRAERARLLGYPDHASYVLEQSTAQTPAAVNTLLRQLAPLAMESARKEAVTLQSLIDQEQQAKNEATFTLEPWDWAYYAEKQRRVQFDFDEAELKPYLEFNNVLEKGVFFAAEQLYGIRFRKRTDLPVYQEDVLVYDVFDSDGSLLAIFIIDPYARPSKRGGAWANAYISQSRLEGTKPVIANHLNIAKAPAGQPTLLTWDEVTTAFHEFGHALHGMFSDVEYPYFSGTRVPRDFVEYPSQFNEMWAAWPRVLQNYARHHQDGSPLPQALIDKVLAAQQFNQGHATLEYLAAAMLDQRWHQIAPEQVPDTAGVIVFENHALNAEGVQNRLVPPRYRTPYFSHIMSGYAAGYYAYIWSEVLDADSVVWMQQQGGLTRENGDHFRRTVLARGGSVEAMTMFKDFTGREPDVNALLARRGLLPLQEN